MEENNTNYTVEDAKSFLKDAAVRYELGQYPMAVYIANLAKETFEKRYHEAGKQHSEDLIEASRDKIQRRYEEDALYTIATKVFSIKDRELRDLVYQTVKENEDYVIKETLRERLERTEEFRELSELIRADFLREEEVKEKVYELLNLTHRDAA